MNSDWSNTFAELIQPVSPAEFFRQYWEKRFLHLHREAANYYDEILTAEDIDRHFQSRQLPAAFLNLVSATAKYELGQWTTLESSPIGEFVRVVEPERLFALFDAGATLIINRAHQAIPKLSRFCGTLRHELKFHARANVYITPPHAQGFPPHYDTHDLFILQLSGRKSWRLYEAPIELPVHPPPLCSSLPTDKEPLYECQLAPGDLLYLPRGLVHEAQAAELTSIHLSLGIQPKYWFHLLEELAAQAQADPAFRQALPHGFSSAQERAEFNREFGERLQTLLATVEVNSLLDISERDFVKTPFTDRRGRFTDLLRAEQLTLDSVVSRRPGLEYRVERTSQEIVVSFEQKTLNVPGFLAPSLELFFQAHPFAVREIAGLLSEQSKLELVNRFVRAGFLTVEAVA